MKQIEELIEISRFYGADPRFVIAGGGNTSYKTAETLWVKASGHALATITEEGFAVIDRHNMENTTPERRPSIETPIHNSLKAAFVVHLHPTLANGLLCSVNAQEEALRLFSEEVLFLPYIAPGKELFLEMDRRVKIYTEKFGHEPSVILLQNHGVIVAADSIEEVRSIYGRFMAVLEQATTCVPDKEPMEIPDCVTEILPALRMKLSLGFPKTLKVVRNSMIDHFAQNSSVFQQIAFPCIPDHIAYCRTRYIYLDKENSQELIDSVTAEQVQKVILIKGIGLIAVADNAKECDTIIETFMDMMQIAFYAQSFGGVHPMSEEQIHFIDNWDAENYRRKIRNAALSGRAVNKTIVITGAAQGFGQGIAFELSAEGANIVVADVNPATGEQTVDLLNKEMKNNRALFVSTDVSNPQSLEQLIYKTVCAFGGLDVFISNAGILRAGNLEEMTPEIFEKVTKINYSAFFFCARAAQRILKLQNAYAPDNYGDIIQINSKSGLRGSKANFAYAGGKFGGIGLVQSFALELAPFRIKVNAICPGNYYEGPLWSDPVNGLFVQYLKAGKVPGAKTVEEVKKHYLSQVPMGKGCTPKDVTRAVLYAMEQTGETGQALAVTGGQVM